MIRTASLVRKGLAFGDQRAVARDAPNPRAAIASGAAFQPEEQRDAGPEHRGADGAGAHDVGGDSFDLECVARAGLRAGGFADESARPGSRSWSAVVSGHRTQTLVVK
jgi:hypothetical protein